MDEDPPPSLWTIHLGATSDFGVASEDEHEDEDEDEKENQAE